MLKENESNNLQKLDRAKESLTQVLKTQIKYLKEVSHMVIKEDQSSDECSTSLSSKTIFVKTSPLCLTHLNLYISMKNLDCGVEIEQCIKK